MASERLDAAYRKEMRRVEHDAAHAAWHRACVSSDYGDRRSAAFLDAALLWEAFALKYDDEHAARNAAACFGSAMRWEELATRDRAA